MSCCKSLQFYWLAQALSCGSVSFNTPSRSWAMLLSVWPLTICNWHVIIPGKPKYGRVQCWFPDTDDFTPSRVQKPNYCVSVSSSSKEAKCDLFPDSTRRPPGLLRGCSALPPAPHLDGQSDCGLCQCHVPVGETETAMPKWPPEWELLRWGESVNLWLLCLSHSLSFTFSPPTLSNTTAPAQRRHLN